MFLVPNTILDGGVTGISIILSQLTPLPLNIIAILINLPIILIIGKRNLGKRFIVRATYALISFAIFLHIFEGYNEFTDDILLALVFGGLLLGIGAGLVIMFGGCIDAIDAISIVISKHTSLSVGQSVLCFNILIYSVAGFLFGADRAMYSLLTYFITFKVVDLVSEGLDSAKAVMIITSKQANISDALLKQLGRTCTLMEVQGKLTGDKVMLYVVVTRAELSEVKEIIEEQDCSAFTTVTDVEQIFGKHIKKKLKQS